MNLRKGQKIDLTKVNPQLQKIVVGLSRNTDGKTDFDLDTSAFLLTSEGKVNSDEDFIFYNNLKHYSGAVEHLGDNLTAEDGGNLEELKVDLAQVPAEIAKIAFAVTIYESEKRRQNFRQVKIYRHGGEWKFNAIGTGFSGGLEAIGRNFGIKTENKTAGISVALYPAVKLDIKKLAAIRQATLSDIVNEALKQFIDAHRHEIKQYDDFIKNLK